MRFDGPPVGAGEAGMDDLSSEIEDVRLDINTLRALIDVAIANSVRADDPVLRACANTLYERHSRLEALLRRQLGS